MRKDKLAADLAQKLEKSDLNVTVVSLVLTISLLALLFLSREDSTESPNQKRLEQTLPDFSQFGSVKNKKAAFFDYLTPIVRQQNLKIRYTRDYLESLSQNQLNDSAHSQAAMKKLMRLAKAYEVESTKIDEILAELKLKVDVIPESLVLVQAANESAWGTSRFAKQANNLFGQWCYKKGCGLVPKGRAKGARHEVRKFRTPSESVASYLKNINSHPAYKSLREIRAKLRKSGQPITGIKLASGLKNYSERRGDYVEEIVQMIQQNSLE